MNLSLSRKRLALLAAPLRYQIALIGQFGWLQVRYADALRRSQFLTPDS